MNGTRIVLFFLVGFLCTSLRAQGDSLFDQATKAYNEGAFSEAIERYQEILASGRHSAPLYYNLGNAHYKLGEIAPSIYYYEKALLLDPDDTEIRNNLAFAQNMTLDAIQPLPQTDIARIYQQVLYKLDSDQWAYLGILFIILFAAGYLAFYLSYRPNIKRIALISSILFFVLCALATSLSYLQYRAFKSDQPAIIFAEECAVRTEPNQGATEAFRLHEGTKVQVRDSLGGWQKILLADGQTGWVTGDALRLLKDF